MTLTQFQINFVESYFLIFTDDFILHNIYIAIMLFSNNCKCTNIFHQLLTIWHNPIHTYLLTYLL